MIITVFKYMIVIFLLILIYYASTSWFEFAKGIGYFIVMLIVYNICASTLISAADAPPPFEPRGHTEGELTPEELAKLKMQRAKEMGSDAISRFFNQASDWANARKGITGDFSWIEEFKNINPPYDLSPGYTDINYKFKNKKPPLWNKTDFCEENPECYPCPGWTDIGTPKCIA